MTREEAIRILDPETSAETLAEIRYFAGHNGDFAVKKAIADARIMEVAALREQEQRRWIPVTKRLPNVFEGVLAYCPKRRNTYLLYNNARGEWHFFDKTVAGALLDEAVTHWMPLPKPPEEGLQCQG